MKQSINKHNSIWWGPPKKFSYEVENTKVSWLELFYDLVYVIVISRATHYLALDPEGLRVIDYLLLFTMVFWGWLNGSMYYDLHGTEGIRTRLMMLWQMMVVAALAVALAKSSADSMTLVIFTFIFLQAYITYLWWSVGIYDKAHRKLNRPYTVCYLIALAFICSTLFVPQAYKKILFCLALFFNFLPSFMVLPALGKQPSTLAISSRMVERLGLFTIIVFGEVILGVINGTGAVAKMNTLLWFCFGIGILIVFSLWWIFFSLIADREVKGQFLKGRIMSLLYIPTLASLGMVGATFSGLIDGLEEESYLDPHFSAVRLLFGTSLAVFLVSICALSRYLEYPSEYQGAHRLLIPLIIAGALLITGISIFFMSLPLVIYLAGIFFVLALIIVVITRLWFKVEVKKLN